ncbi:MAG: hypothetical protein KKH83_05950, partial [Candidatus Margulisbacteria bacterium]|nr:hypothetical protein [Candidatus Margulisiibacteriota bacterium]
KWVALLSVLGALAIYSHTKMPRPSRCGFGVGIYLFLSKDRGKGHRAIGSLLFLPMIVFFVASMLLNLSSGMTVISWLQYEVRNFHYHQIFSYLHPYNVSSWLWPFWASTPMFEGKRSVIAMGNPFVLWLMVPVLGYLCCRWWKERDAALLFILIGFFVNYLSWLVYDLLGLTPFFKSRGLFFYYFMPALPFYFIGLGYLLDKMLSHKYARLAAWTYLLAVVLSFAVLSPVAYGMEGWLTVIWKR